MNAKKGNRLLGAFPKVGIRPVIDGRRRGVRESLEEQTMNMAKSAAELISKSLKYPDGSDVVCVIADTTIGGVAEAAACADKFQREGVGVSLTVTPCWCYGSETMDMDPFIPKAVWGFNGTERPGAVYLAAVLAAHAQMGLPAFGIYGRNVQDANDTTIPDDVFFVTFPGEVFVEFALEVKKNAKAAHTVVVGLANDYVGYIPNQEAFRQGGYEIKTAQSSKLSETAGNVLVEEILKLTYCL
jgi:hypothetical protein